MRVEPMESGFDGVTVFAFTLDDGRRLNIDVIAPGVASVDWQIGVEIEGQGAAFQFVAISPWLAFDQAVAALRERGLAEIDWNAIRAELERNGAFPL